MANTIASIRELAQVPECAYPAYAAIAAAGCGPSLACICANDNFFLALQGTILAGNCSLVEAQGEAPAIVDVGPVFEGPWFRQICVQAVPWINDNRGPEVVAIITVLTVLSTIAVLLRIMARRISKIKLGVEDYLIIVALIWAYGLTITQYMSVQNGFGRHMLMLDLPGIIAFTKTFFAIQFIFCACATAVKLSVLFFYHRVFPIRPITIATSIIGLVVVAWFVGDILVVFLQCKPIQYNWDKSIPGGHCINANNEAYYGTTPPDIATNIALLILPIPILWNLQMRPAKKIALTIIFILGGFATVGSIVRIPLLTQLKPTDVSYSVVNPGLWLSVENNVGIVSVCLPLLRPLFKKTYASAIRQRFTKPRSSRYGGGSQRLPDSEKGPQSTTLSRTEDMYLGGAKKHKFWYNNEKTASENEEERSDGSQEDIIPMGKITVSHDVSWEDGVPLPPSAHA